MIYEYESELNTAGGFNVDPLNTKINKGTWSSFGNKRIPPPDYTFSL
jgi:hypothetical protein